MSLGEILKSNREQHKLKLDDVASRLNIQEKYLRSLESNDFKSLPADIYVNCFLKLYGNLLGLDVEELIELYKRSAKKGSSATESVVTTSQGFFSRMYQNIVLPHLIRSVVLLCCIAVFLVYIGYNVVNLIQPPDLIVVSPANNSIIHDNYVEVSGNADKEVIIYVNDKHVLGGQSGEFRTTINLQKGINIIKITAQNRHGKEAYEYIKVMYEVKDGDSQDVGRR